MALCYVCLGAPGTQRVTGYGVLVCGPCWERAERGWPAHQEPALMQALARAGLLIPDRNERGLLPRTYMPPEDFAL